MIHQLCLNYTYLKHKTKEYSMILESKIQEMCKEEPKLSLDFSLIEETLRDLRKEKSRPESKTQSQQAAGYELDSRRRLGFWCFLMGSKSQQSCGVCTQRKQLKIRKNGKKARLNDGQISNAGTDHENGQSELKDNKPNLTNSSITYSLEEQFLAEQFYAKPVLDYKKLFSNESTRTKQPKYDDLASTSGSSDVKSMMMSDEEAGKKITRVCYAQLLGTSSDVSCEDREQVVLWGIFESAKFNYFLSQQITRDVNIKNY